MINFGGVLGSSACRALSVSVLISSFMPKIPSGSRAHIHHFPVEGCHGSLQKQLRLALRHWRVISDNPAAMT